MLNSNISNESAQGFGEWLRESNYAFIYKTMAGIFNTVEPWIDEKIINEMLKDVTEIDSISYILCNCHPLLEYRTA